MDIVKSLIKKPIPLMIISTIFIVLLFIIQEIRTRCKINRLNVKMKEKHDLTLLKYEDHQKYLQQLEQNNQNMKKKYIYRKLHDLYYNGVPDKYDLKGNKIKGIKPDPKKAINYLTLSHQYGNNEALLKLAQIHHNGMFNLEPDLKKAEQYYKDAINNSSNRDQLLDAQDGLQKLIEERKNLSIYNWLNLKPKKRKNEHHTRCENIWNPRKNQTRPQSQPQQINKLFTQTFTSMVANETQTRPLNNLFRANGRRYRHPAGVRTERIEDPVAVVVRRDTTPNYNDAHNTHNSQVLSTIKNSLKKLKNSTKIFTSLPNTLRDIRYYINSCSKSDKREDALKSLDSIEKSTSPLTFCKMKEVDALNLVWNRIHNDKHDSNRSDLKKTLFNELAEMQEHGKTVCSTGKFTRIVDTLNVVDDEVAIKPTYAINQEMMNKSANIRKEMLSKFSESQQKELDMGTSNMQEQFESDLKNKIRADLKKDYVDSKILTDQKFNNELNKWIDHI